MSPSRAERVGLYARALREALESAAGKERATGILSRALNHAGLSIVPEELEAFRVFTEGALRNAAERDLRPTEVETVFELIGHVLWMATSDVQSRGEIEIPTDDASGERTVDVPFRVPQLPPTPVPADEIETRATPTPEQPRVRRQSVALGRIARPSAPGGVIEIGPTDTEAYDSSARRRPVTLDVLVLTLDPLLVFETDNGLAGRGRVTAIQTAAELARAASAAKSKLVVLVDSALPSIDLPTFAPISGSLPPGTRIVLWGVDDRQKQRLSLMFPAAKDWIASGRAASPAEVILDL